MRRKGASGGLTALILGAVILLFGSSGTAQAAGPPLLGPAWSGEVAATSARLHSTVNPDGLSTHYRFDYITAAAYEANLAQAKEGFAGALKAPAGAEAPLGSGTTPIAISQPLSSLGAETAYRYRLVAANSAESVTGPTLSFVTQGLGGGALLADGRGWEMVSPLDKNGGGVAPPGSIAGGGVLQAAADGTSVTYSSSASFGAGAQGAPPGSQYLATRGEGGWSTANITTPILSGSYGAEPEGVPYQLFSPDLARGLLLSGERCRGEGTQCPVANPPLPGSGAPAGYQDYYLREAGAFTSLLTPSDLAHTALSASEFSLALVGATPQLTHVVVSSCAALGADAVEVPAAGGCDPAAQNLYIWGGGGLRLLNLLPAQSTGTPGATLAAQSGAISANGARVYWVDGAGRLYLNEAGHAKAVDESGEAEFQLASADGSLAYFLRSGHLYRYSTQTEEATDLTPGGGVAGVLGASEDGAYVYFQDATGLQLSHDGAIATVAAGAEAAAAGDYPPATGTARVSADGTHLLFLSRERLTGYDNTDQGTGEPDSEVYLYDTAGPGLACLSCNPTEERPIGRSTIPGAIANGAGPAATDSYKPRALVAGGRRVFFDSADALLLADTNNAPDAYEWEAQGTGSCARAGGCLALISSGRAAAAEGGASFADASADGSDAFFLTPRSLVGTDPGAVDLYDAREGGGFPEPPTPIPCQGDACQFLPSEPLDPTLTTLIPGLGNPRVRYLKHCKPGSVKRKGRCVKRKHRAKHSLRARKRGQR